MYAIDIDVSGEVHIGGLVSWNRSGKIESSYLIGGNVSGEIHIGGLVSWNRSGKIESSYLIGGNVSGEINVGVFDSTNIGGAYLESCSTVSRLDDSNISENPDLELSRGKHKLSYVVESNTLYIHVSDEIYSCSVSPTQVQLLVDDTSEVEMTDRFRASVVEET